MPRIARAVVEGVPYHVTQRGNRREDTFFDDEDRQKYLEWLPEYSGKHGLKIWAYCLMTNHVHLIAVPQKRDSLERVMRPLHTRYAQYINRKNRWSGHLWQGRFFSSALDERYLWAAIRYVEGNPVRAAWWRSQRNINGLAQPHIAVKEETRFCHLIFLWRRRYRIGQCG